MCLEKLKDFISQILENNGFLLNGEDLSYGFVDDRNDSRLWMMFTSEDQSTSLSKNINIKELQLDELMEMITILQDAFLEDSDEDYDGALVNVTLSDLKFNCYSAGIDPYHCIFEDLLDSLGTVYIYHSSNDTK